MNGKTLLLLGAVGVGVYFVYKYAQASAQSPTSQLVTALGGAGSKIITSLGSLFGGSDSSSSDNQATGKSGDGMVHMTAISPAGALDTNTTAWSSTSDAAIADGLPSARLAGRALQPTSYMDTSQRAQFRTRMPVN